MPVNANTSLPANSPLRSAPLVEGKIYKNTDTNKCIGKFAGIKHLWRALANNSGRSVPYYEYHFNNYNYETASFDKQSKMRFGTRDESDVIKHNLVEVNEGECGRDYESRAAAIEEANIPEEPMSNSRALAIAAAKENRGMRGGRKSRKARKTRKSRKHGSRRH